MFFINYYFADSCDFGVLVRRGKLRIPPPSWLLSAVILNFSLLRQGKQNTKINKWNCIKLKFFWIVKELFNKTKWQSTEWEEIFANDIFDRKFIPKIYKDFAQLKWQPTPVLLPGKFHGWRSLISPWGLKESVMTEWLHLLHLHNSTSKNWTIPLKSGQKSWIDSFFFFPTKKTFT